MDIRIACINCVWNKPPSLTHCIRIRNQGDKACSRFSPRGKKVDTRLCGNCDREKDPGRCWWCEEVNA